MHFNTVDTLLMDSLLMGLLPFAFREVALVLITGPLVKMKAQRWEMGRRKKLSVSMTVLLT